MSLLKVAGTTASSGTLYVNDVFSVYLYTGNGSTQTITNGIDLAGKGGLIWTKSRNLTNNNNLVNTVSGVGKSLASNNTAMQQTQADQVTAFNSDGYSLGADAVQWEVNRSGYTYASWTFRKAAKFFDVVTYTGNGSARTIAHSLGVAPGMIIVKSTSNSEWWAVQHISLGATKSLYLNSTNAQETNATNWNDTSPTSSVFTVGTNTPTNASGQTYVAYLFAHDTDADGIIQCGSFTTNGTVAGYDITLGWEPQYVLVKRTDSAGNWQILDTMRGFDRTGQNYLFANLSNAESANPNDTTRYPTATGFHYGNTGSDSGTSFIYMAIRRPNKPPTSGTQVYNAIARTGTGATAAVTGLGFTPDFVFPMGRSATSGYASVFDRLRGVNIFMDTSSAGSETTASQSLMSFNMDGFTLGSSTTYLNTNVSARTYINWSFKRAPGFFDEVCYTGTGSATTIAHNLGVVPEMMIVKQRNSSFARVWVVYTSAVGNTKYLVLNTNVLPVISPDVWNNTTPTASVFSIGNDSYVNDSATATYVAYLFATLAGISKVGSYTGNGTGQVIACGFSAGARFVLIKRTDSTGDWYTFDSARGLTSGSSPYLLLNSAAAETTGDNGVYASTGGFTLSATAITTTNIATATYIFLAVA